MKKKYPPGRILKLDDDTYEQAILDLKYLMVFEVQSERCGETCHRWGEELRKACKILGA